jgi:hypothetical protein
MTPYEKHGQAGHRTTRYSPNGIDVVEECLDCSARWLHNPCIGYPVAMRDKALGGWAWFYDYTTKGSVAL